MGKKQIVFIILAAIVAVSQIANAQNGSIEDGQTTASASGGSTNGPIVIVNKYSGSQDTRQDSRVDSRQGALSGSTAGATAVQEQPLTVIESTPLRESRADQIRRARLSVEAQTETKIVEKLEAARIEDERQRQDRVLGAVGSGASVPQPQPQTYQQPVQQPVPPPVQQQQPQQVQQPIVIQASPVQVVPVVVKEREEREEREERAEIKTSFYEERRAEPTENRYFISGNAGLAEYANRSNVRGNGALGFTVGTTLSDGLIAEGSFLYSTYTVDVVQPGAILLPPVVNLTQYNAMGALKYQFGHGRFRPFGGAVTSYSYRRYQDKYGGGYAYSYDASTNALDVGLVAGADVEVTRRFLVGADVRYLTNLVASNPGTSRTFYPVAPGSAIEKSDYYTVQITGKFMF